MRQFVFLWPYLQLHWRVKVSQEARSLQKHSPVSPHHHPGDAQAVITIKTRQ